MAQQSLTDGFAHQLRAELHARRLSCRELMQATLVRIAVANPVHNAIVSLRDEAALLADADARDAELAAGRSAGWLHGIPIAVKDLASTAGIRTTMGSPLLADHVPSRA